MALTVIIPALDAARFLPATLAALRTTPALVDDIVLVDGGSRDDTVAVARAAGVRVLTAMRGRGPQLTAGVAAADTDWLLLLHADTVLGPDWAKAVSAHFISTPQKAGYFRFVLASADPRARRLEKAVAWRCRMLALPYGDQGLLIRRDLLRAVGGIRPLPLMEDVDLVRRLGHRRLAPLAAIAQTSAEKWERDGWYRRSARNLTCLALYFMGIPPRIIARLYS